jgi:predicted phage-related endonuclease
VRRRRACCSRDELDPVAVGASQVGAIAGVDPFCTPLELWRRKLGRAAGPDPELEPLRIGRALEGPVVDLARQAIPLPIRRNRRTFVHPRWPEVQLFATPDAFVGTDRLLEAKVVGLRAAFAWDDGPPEHVVLQARAQLAVLEADACYVVALLGTELRLTLVERELELEAELLAGVTAFVDERLLAGVEPDPVTDAERWARLVAGAGRLEGEVLADADADALGMALVSTRNARTRLEADERQLREQLAGWLERSGGRKVAGTSWSAAWDARGTFAVRSKETR